MFDEELSTRSSDGAAMLGMPSSVFYVVVFAAVGMVLLGVVIARRRWTVDEEMRDSQFTYDDALSGTKTIFDVKSPYLAEKAAGTLEKVGLERASSYIRASSFGYSDIGQQQEEGGFGMESPYVTAQKEEEIEMTKPSNFSYEDMAGQDSMFAEKSPMEVAREEELEQLEKPSNFSYEDVVRQPSLQFSTENSLHTGQGGSSSLVPTGEDHFGVSNDQWQI
jgi:hypothetical protein